MSLQQYWTQPSTSTQRNDLRPGLQARVQDPLWMLLRQWQMGEFHGEDAGSPVLAEIERDAFLIDRVSLDGAAEPWSPSAGPLEAVVEREARQQVLPDLRTRAQAGRELAARIVDAGLDLDAAAFATQHAFDPAEVAAAESAAVRLLVRRAPDGEGLFAALRSGLLDDAALSALLPGASGAMAPYRAVIASWVSRYEARTGRPEAAEAWLERRLEYRFEVSVPTDVGRYALDAPEHHGGRLDWDAFTVASVDTQDTVAVTDRSRETMLVSPVRYVGMPAPRWWQYEDAAVDFGDTRSSDNNLGRLLLAEFTMAWGNDWFLIPLEAPLGSLCRVNELLVTDTFGVTTRVLPQAAHSPHWGMNRLSQASGTGDMSDMLFLPPVLPSAQESAPIEELRLMRDELANMAWAVEQTVSTPLGRPEPVADESVRDRQTMVRPQAEQGLRYQVMTDLPSHWFPLLPVREPTDGARYLVRAGLLDELQAQAPEPAGALLGGAAPFQLHDEEVPRSGAIVTRSHQLTRWHGGARTLWLSRRKRAGAGELRSQLEHDRLLGVDPV